MANIMHSVGMFQELVQHLVGLPVSLPWKGYGSTIFLELGQLAPLEPHQRHQNGEACIWLQWDWRVEDSSAVLFGSSNSGPKIERGLRTLEESCIQSLSVIGEIPELIVRFSNGQCARSMVMHTGDPKWIIRLQSGEYLSAKEGALQIDNGEGGAISVTEQESRESEVAKDTALRWGTPVQDPKFGECKDCQSFVRLDGDYYILDYGVCTAAGGPFDGRAVKVSSGCPSFAQ
jgi:hypothetical protein